MQPSLEVIVHTGCCLTIPVENRGIVKYQLCVAKTGTTFIRLSIRVLLRERGCVFVRQSSSSLVHIRPGKSLGLSSITKAVYSVFVRSFSVDIMTQEGERTQRHKTTDSKSVRPVNTFNPQSEKKPNKFQRNNCLVSGSYVNIFFSDYNPSFNIIYHIVSKRLDSGP